MSNRNFGDYVSAPLYPSASLLLLSPPHPYFSVALSVCVLIAVMDVPGEVDMSDVSGTNTGPDSGEVTRPPFGKYMAGEGR